MELLDSRNMEISRYRLILAESDKMPVSPAKAATLPILVASQVMLLIIATPKALAGPSLIEYELALRHYVKNWTTVATIYLEKA